MHEGTEYIEYHVAMILWKSFPPICLVLGTFGNVLTIIILMQRKNRNSSTAIYLTALAASDLLVLWVGLSRLWIKYVSGTDLIDLSVVWCKLQAFLVYTGFQCSSWFLVAVTSERFLAVWFPHKVRLLCKPRNSGIAIIMISGFLALLNSHWYYGLSILSYSENKTEELLCEYIDDENYVNFIKIWDWIDLFLVSLVPVSLLSIANSSIIFFIIKRRKTALNRIAPLNDPATGSGSKVSQMTITLITVNTVFVVCSTPLSIFIIKKPFSETQTERDSAEAELWWALVNFLAYTNTSINFVLYFLSGSEFRKQVKAFFKRKSSTNVPGF